MTQTSSSAEFGAYSAGERAAIIVSCMLGFALDLYDVLIMPFLMSSIQGSLGISLTQVASVTSLTLVGSVIGGALFGWLGDRIGRKQALQLTLGVFAIGSIASAFAWDYASLAVLRFITGVGLGGEWGAGMVLFNEAWNKERRGLGSAFIQGSAVIASAGASIVGVWATTSFSPEWGWRVALLTGGSPIVLMIFIRFFMPESKAWLQFDRARNSGLVARKASTANTLLLMFRGELLPVSIMCLAWMMAYMFAYYGIVVFMPTLMQKSLGAPPEVVRNISVIASVVGGCSYLTMGLVNDAFGRRFGALLPGLAWGVMACGLYLFAHDRFGGHLLGFPMFWTYIAFVIGNSALGVVGTWLSEIYPIEVRSTAVSFIYMAGRGVGSLAPVVVPLAAAAFGGELAMGMLIVVPAIVLFLAMTLSLPETRGRELAAVDAARRAGQAA
ncbi:MFS transporter [Bradyrhizobium diazoefficiens]|nr:MFS transporter [Bradyrhizobium diazoefficiens]UCF51981.1 MAG: MFS transporter [Bradyrhizobium sp.]MBR0966736.1 MFS transporter [Bradyrhizobium diazoefficiens]MBR0980248.1 MFS transporter [Bradyrhizobium diazoefficiens]MBR1009596.1 MFS transporter [Bradyrhizobium diazoefficiens]MBR1016179.1 MFS transporter [Bradyrhizobium diazoefficiens]